MIVLRANDVWRALADRDRTVVDIVAGAYVAHARGKTVLPHSTLVSLGGDGNRIIALPAVLNSDNPIAGLKWIASVPGNIQRLMDRASAVVVLNDVGTGRPFALIEGALISARRTAASALLAARTLSVSQTPRTIAIIGCGYISWEAVRMLPAVLPSINEIRLFDIAASRAEYFRQRLLQLRKSAVVTPCDSWATACSTADLVLFATTAMTPYVDQLSNLGEYATVLHVSLRDLTPNLILQCDNIVDDPDHVCRAGTSLQLAEQQTGGREFISCALGDVILKSRPFVRANGRVAVFSPFGLGILDVAVAQLVITEALQQGLGTRIPNFFAVDWRLTKQCAASTTEDQGHDEVELRSI